MNKLFLTILNLLSAESNIIEAVMYKNGDFARIEFEAKDLISGKYSISISKEKETDGNS